MSKSKIEWTDKVWNPVTGCTKISDGCKNCYAERIFPRVYVGRNFNQIMLHEDRLVQPLHWKKPSMIFVNSMSDLFHEDIPSKFILDCLSVMSHTDCLKHKFQILTKRPMRAKMLFDEGNFELPENIWMGVSVENQKTADERIPVLLQIPANIRWISVEPMLDKIDLCEFLDGLFYDNYEIDMQGNQFDWVVVGAESGPKRRECKIEWVESIVEQCKSAGVPVFVKQIHLNGKLEKDITKFPKEVQIREYPK